MESLTKLKQSSTKEKRKKNRYFLKPLPSRSYNCDIILSKSLSVLTCSDLTTSTVESVVMLGGWYVGIYRDRSHLNLLLESDLVNCLHNFLRTTFPSLAVQTIFNMYQFNISDYFSRSLRRPKKKTRSLNKKMRN